MRATSLVCAAASALFLAGCFGGTSRFDPDADTPTSPLQDVTTPPPSGKATVLGQVLAESGGGLAGVSVSGGGAVATTDANGRVDLVVPAAGTTVLVFEKAGFAPAYRAVTPQGAGAVTVAATLFAVDVQQQVDVQAGAATVNVPGGAAVELPQGSIRTTSGQTPTSPVTVEVTWVSPAEAGALAPVPLVGSDGQGTWPLISYGMVDVSVTWNGVKCGLAAGQAIKLTLPAAPGDPESAGLFSADTSLGLWTLEGAAANAGQTWTAYLPHLSWWNVDAFYKVPKDNQCCVSFYAYRPNGKAASGVSLSGTIQKGGTYSGSTDADGTLCEERFPCGETLSVKWSDVGAGGYKNGIVSVTPYAKGGACGTASCQTAEIALPCRGASDCGAGQTCDSGVCSGVSVVPDIVQPPKDATADPDAMCVPKCAPGQCSNDGCGKPCMACPDGQVCGAGGQCATCVPSCAGATCGSDGCNGSCGICAPGTSCAGTACVDPCTVCGASCSAFGFEGAAALTGWDVSGDVAVIQNLGGSYAPEGQGMLRLSTGLAFSSPSYAQKALCATTAAGKVAFQWRLYSEEFIEFCGSSYQDYFSVSIQVNGTKTELLKLTIDDLCPAGANGCAACGGKSVGVAAADVAFDKGDVQATPWQTASLALPAGSNAGTLIFEVNDVGDSAYDTVVLVDGIVVTP